MEKYTLFIGIDISKSWIDVSLSQDGQKDRMSHRQFDNQAKGFKQMLKWIQSYAEQAQLATHYWVFCMEHTGVYHLPLCCYLRDQQLDYVLETALRIHKSLGLKRGKDDKADSMDIARYAYLHRKELKINDLPDHIIMKLKNLLAFRARLIKQKNALQVAAKEMAAFSLAQWTEDIVEDTDQITTLIKEKIRKVEQRLKQIIAQCPEVQQIFDLVTSVKGIGKISAMYLIVYTNAFRAFTDARKFACYVGIAPFFRRSGSSTDQPAKVSSLGNRKLKTILSNAVMAAIKHDKQLKAYYLRKVAEGKHKFSVMNAVKNKLISRVFAVVKRKTPFIELNAYA